MRERIEEQVRLHFHAEPERLFAKYPSFSVYRHRDNRKWFCVFMTIPRSKLEAGAQGEIFVVNVKCDEDRVDDLWQMDGIYPAYHMSKRHWITCALDGRVPPDRVLFLIGRSFELTGKK